MAGCYSSYSRICVYMDISKDLPNSTWLTYKGMEYEQTLDYENIPFRCQKFHEHGHLFRDFPHNHIHTPEPSKQDPKDFTKVQLKKNQVKKGNPRKQPNSAPPNPLVNSFEVLAKLAEHGDPTE